MDDDTAELIVRLCTRAGMIMEDQSLVALTIGKDGVSVAITLAALAGEVQRISALIAAARAVLPAATAASSSRSQLPTVRYFVVRAVPSFLNAFVWDKAAIRYQVITCRLRSGADVFDHEIVSTIE